MRNATGRREVAGEVFKDLYGIHTAYYLTINDLGKSKGEKLVTIIALMPSWRCFISTEGLEYRTGSSLGL